MFNPSREEVRRFFFETWRKYRDQAPLEGLEKTALEVVLLHPEYHALLHSEDRSIDRDFLPEVGTQSIPASVAAPCSRGTNLDRSAARNPRAACRTFDARRVGS